MGEITNDDANSPRLSAQRNYRPRTDQDMDNIYSRNTTHRQLPVSKFPLCEYGSWGKCNNGRISERRDKIPGLPGPAPLSRSRASGFSACKKVASIRYHIERKRLGARRRCGIVEFPECSCWSKIDRRMDFQSISDEIKDDWESRDTENLAGSQEIGLISDGGLGSLCLRPPASVTGCAIFLPRVLGG